MVLENVATSHILYNLQRNFSQMHILSFRNFFIKKSDFGIKNNNRILIRFPTKNIFNKSLKNIYFSILNSSAEHGQFTD